MSEYIDFTVRVPKSEADMFIARIGKSNVKILGYLLGEEIVRCKDCKRYISQGTYRFENGVTNKATCDVIRGFIVQIDPDGFCAWGERKN